MMSPGMQKLKSHFMNTETPSMGGMKKKNTVLWSLLFVVGAWVFVGFNFFT